MTKPRALVPAALASPQRLAALRRRAITARLFAQLQDAVPVLLPLAARAIPRPPCDVAPMPRAFSGGMPERPFLLARELAPDFERSQAAEDTQEQRVLIFPILARRTLARLRRATRAVNQ